MQTNKRINIDEILKSPSLRETFTNFNVKYYGFETVDDFYKAGNLDTKIRSIQIPTIFLNAADDMFSPTSGNQTWLFCFLLFLKFILN